VPELCFGCGTFGGHKDEFFKAWGAADVAEAAKIVDICMEAGVNFFDTADIYSYGASESVLGAAIQHLRREDVLISTKATFRFGKGANDVGSSRYHLIQSLEGSLKRLGTDYVDVYHLHETDSLTPVDEMLSTLDQFVRDGKVRYIACSNFSGWRLMKSLSVSERYGWSRYIGHQVYYSLVGRDYEWELMPLAVDQGLCIQKGAVTAAFVDHVELALLIENGGMVAGDESVRQYQVAVLQPPDGEGRMRNVDLFLPGIVDQQQSSGWNCFGHGVPFEIAPEVGCALAKHTGLMLRKLPHAQARRTRLPTQEISCCSHNPASLSAASKRP